MANNQLHYNGPVNVRCRNVVKEFGTGATKVRVLRGVDMDIPRGQTTFLVGPSGCGKTTLISIVAGLLTPDSGLVEVNEQRLDSMKPHQMVDFRRDNIGFIFQQFNLLPALTAAENAAVALLAQRVPWREAIDRAGDMLNRLDLGNHLGKRPSEMSGGQQQRVAIARALVHEPRIIISDEPTASLDAKTGHQVMQLLQDVASSSDRSVIVVTHDNRIFEFADRMLHMSDGQIVDVEENPTRESH